MYADVASQWLQQAVGTIPLRNSDVFIQLLDKKRLNFVSGSKGADSIDRSNAHLATSTLERHLRLMIVFPDDSAQRPPLLFASALVSQWWDGKTLGHSPGKVIYFGTTVGIRQHLSQARVGKLSLDSVFSQYNPSSIAGARRRSESVIGDSDLPEVICAYSPADTVALVNEFRPKWIAIDCGKEARIRWLPELLRRARELQIPVIAWSNNPLSEAVKDFQRSGEGEVIRWPFQPSNGSGSEIAPIIIETSDDRFEHCLRSAYALLSKATAQRNSGRLVTDALGIAWKLQRSLEQLSVPLGLFEQEAVHYWGIQRINKLVAGAQRFIQALSSSRRQLSETLADALSLHQQAIQLIDDTEPPLWMTLTGLCVEERSPGDVRIIVFSGPARKQMFALALLAKCNITEEDLNEIGIHLASLNDLHDKVSAVESDTSPLRSIYDAAQKRSVLLTSLPSKALSPRMVPLLSLGGFDVLVYSYQVSALAKRVEEWNEGLSVSTIETEKVVSRRSGKAPSQATLSRNATVKLGYSRVFSIATGRTERSQKASTVVAPLDETAEIRWLLEEGEAHELEPTATVARPSQDEVVWTQDALEIRFSGGWRGLFALYDSLNVVMYGASSERVEERFVRSIRVGDRVLFIHGQKRQSLYELIISRVHNHPAIEIHLALISKWQEELAQSFRAHLAKGWAADDVLAEIQRQGSSIGSTQTVKLWLLGRTLAPNDPQDLIRLGKAMQLPFVTKYHARISKAAQRIRGLHRGLSNRLNNWLHEQATGGADTALQVFDDELGLSFQDFRDSLAVFKVEKITKVSGPFLWQSLGALEREQDAP